MTIATRRNDRWTSGSVSDNRSDDATAVTRPTASMTGWYDPDGAGWEPEPAATFEALRATVPGGQMSTATGDALDR